MEDLVETVGTEKWSDRRGLEQVSGHHPKTRVMDLFEHMLEMQASTRSVSSTDRCVWACCGADIHGSQVRLRLFPDGDAEHSSR